MDAEEILAATGGLPPSAFSLSSHPIVQGGSSAVLPEQNSSVIAGLDESDEAFLKWKHDLTETNFWPNLPIPSVSAPEVGQDTILDWDNISHKASEQVSYEQPPVRRYNIFPPDEIRETPSHDTRIPLRSERSEQDKILTQPANGTGDVPSKKKRAWVSATMKRVLDSQFLNNPYPAKSRIAELATETNLKEKQVKNWFTNRRSPSSPQGS